VIGISYTRYTSSITIPSPWWHLNILKVKQSFFVLIYVIQKKIAKKINVSTSKKYLGCNSLNGSFIVLEITILFIVFYLKNKKLNL